MFTICGFIVGGFITFFMVELAWKLSNMVRDCESQKIVISSSRIGGEMQKL